MSIPKVPFLCSVESSWGFSRCVRPSGHSGDHVCQYGSTWPAVAPPLPAGPVHSPDVEQVVKRIRMWLVQSYRYTASTLELDEVLRREIGTLLPAGPVAPPPDLTFRELVEANLSRVKRWHTNGGLQEWSALEWAGAMAGEAGEACNAAKKLKRIDGDLANINLEAGRSLTDRQVACRQVAKEVADTIIYGASLVALVGEDLGAVVADVFNQKSEEYGFPERIGEAPRGAARPPQPATDEQVRESAKRMMEKHRPSLEKLANLARPPASPPALEALIRKWRSEGFDSAQYANELAAALAVPPPRRPRQPRSKR